MTMHLDIILATTSNHIIIYYMDSEVMIDNKVTSEASIQQLSFRQQAYPCPAGALQTPLHLLLDIGKSSGLDPGLVFRREPHVDTQPMITPWIGCCP